MERNYFVTIKTFLMRVSDEIGNAADIQVLELKSRRMSCLVGNRT